MGGWNDVGGVQAYLQSGPGYAMKLLWRLALLFPILFSCQEMVTRLRGGSRWLYLFQVLKGVVPLVAAGGAGSPGGRHA